MRRPLLAGFVALALAASMASVGPAGATPAKPPAKPVAKPGGSSLITLVTGDQVRLTSFPGGKQAAEAIPGPGRSRMSFQISTAKGETTVVPADAMPLIAAGRLDSRLFDVSLLARDGYDDAHRTDIPLLSTGPTGVRAAAVAGSQVKAAYPRIGITVSRTQKKAAGAFWRNVRSSPKTLVAGVGKIWLDGRTKASLDQSVPQIGAPEAWKAGYDGKNVPVAVLDTGLDAQHPDFAGEVLASQDFSGSSTGTQDHFGHGTHVASTVAGSGAASGGKYKGVAPGAKLLIGKVLGDDGYGTDSMIIAGMQWAVDQHARVVNMSLGSEYASDGTDPISQALNTLSAQSGTLFVAASGNAGDLGEHVGAPAAADAALAVAAVTKQDEYVNFSNPGPRLNDYATKPDISAPGLDIVAARAAGTDIGEPVGDNYVRLSGTSMASPHVAGSAAILVQEHPDWKADQLKAALMSTSKPIADATVFQQGAGRVDVARAYKQQVTGTGSLSYGLFSWPHPGQQPVTKTTTYTNDGDSPVTLALTQNVSDENGKPAPADGFTLSANNVTVPAHGTAKVDATFDPLKAPPGQYGGWITATAGDTVVRTGVGAYDEPERHTLAVTAVDRSGKPGIYGSLQIYNRTTGETVQAGFDDQGKANLRLAPGRLAVMYAGAQVSANVALDSTAMSAGDVNLSKDVALTFDTRTAKAAPIKLDAPDPAGPRVLGWYLAGKAPVTYGFQADAGVPWYSGSVGAPAADIKTYDLSSLTRPDAILTGPNGLRLNLGYLATSPRATSNTNPTVVNGGNGTPADLSKVDVKGKVVVAVPTDNDASLVPTDVAKAGGIGVIIGQTIFQSGFSTVPFAGYTVDQDLLQPLLAALGNGPVKVNLNAMVSSPYRYDLLFQDSGGFPDGKPRTVGNNQLAHVRATYRAPGTAGVRHGMAPFFVGIGQGTATVRTVRVALPSTQDQYLTASTRWLKEAGLADFFDMDNGSFGFSSAPWQSYQVGRTVAETWNSAVYAPRVSTPDPWGNGDPWAYRSGDTIAASLPLTVDGGANLQSPGCFFGDPTQTQLLRDGKPVAGQVQCVGNGQWTVPADGSGYQLSAHVPLTGVPGLPLSSDVTATWTFRSSHVDGTAKQPLPLLDVRYAPIADTFNRVAANTVVPIQIGRQTGSPASEISSVQAWVSYDDGKTWKAVAARGAGATWFLPVSGGKSGGFVGLRVKATDKSGNAVDETIQHAYEIR
jgi:subtilisin family serine protease